MGGGNLLELIHTHVGATSIMSSCQMSVFVGLGHFLELCMLVYNEWSGIGSQLVMSDHVFETGM